MSILTEQTCGAIGRCSIVVSPAQGPQGPSGPASTIPGPQGPVGPVGPASTIPGPQGPQGPVGPAGPATPALISAQNFVTAFAGPITGASTDLTSFTAGPGTLPTPITTNGTVFTVVDPGIYLIHWGLFGQSNGDLLLQADILDTDTSLILANSIQRTEFVVTAPNDLQNTFMATLTANQHLVFEGSTIPALGTVTLAADSTGVAASISFVKLSS